MKQILAISAIAVAFAGIVVNAVGADSQTDPISSKIYLLGQGMLAYASDHDDTLPLGFAKIQDQWRWNKIFRAPDISNPDANVWANSVKPYWQFSNALALDAPTHVYNPNFSNGDAIGITYNGLLHQLKVGSVEHKQLVPLMWTPYGNQNFYGAIANPSLACIMPSETCIFGQMHVRGVHFSAPKDIVDFESKLYTVSLDLTVRKPNTITTVDAWQNGIFVSNARAYPVKMLNAVDMTAYPPFFAPNRSE